MIKFETIFPSFLFLKRECRIIKAKGIVVHSGVGIYVGLTFH